MAKSFQRQSATTQSTMYFLEDRKLLLHLTELQAEMENCQETVKVESLLRELSAM